MVIKLATAVIAKNNGEIANKIIRKIAAGIAILNKQYCIVLVSGGAVGKSFLKNYKDTLLEWKAAAAIGNPLLIQPYHRHFKNTVSLLPRHCAKGVIFPTGNSSCN